MEENFSELPHKTFENALSDFIKNRLSHEEYDIEICAGSKKGDNALGKIYRVKVTPKDCEKFNLIFKVSPENVSRREQFLTHEIFIREIKFYNEIFPMYKNFQEKKGIDVDSGEGFHHVAKCFKSLTEEPLEGQIFEDLGEKGFSLHDRSKSLSHEHVFLIMKALAKMHATFLCIKDQEPEMIEKYKNIEDLLIKIFKVKDSACLLWHQQEADTAIEALKDCKNKDLVDRVQKLLKEDIVNQFEKALSGKDAEPYAVLCHGDCWNNNLLYKNDSNGQPIEIRMLDFQMTRYASPATDLGYYIFGCTTKKMRDEHYQEYLDTYYDTLADFIMRLGSDPEKVFPRVALNDQMKKFAKFGILMGVMLVAAFVSDESDAPNMDELTENFKADSKTEFSFVSQKKDIYHKRMMEVFEDMYELGYI